MKPFLETNRKANVGNIAKAIAVGVAVAVPMVMFVAPMLAERQMAVLSAGDTVVGPNVYRGEIKELREDGTAVIVERNGKGEETVSVQPIESLREL